MSKAQKSIVTVSITRGASCDAEQVVNTTASAKTVMHAAKLIAREYKDSGFACDFSADMKIDGVSVNPYTEISYAEPVISARALIAICAVKSDHAAISKALAQ